MGRLQDGLSHLPHLLTDGQDFMNKVSRVCLPLACRFVKLDIKDFYMSDTHDALVANSSLSVDVAERDDYRCMASAVWRSQFVKSSFHSHAFRSKVGAGMGMLSSGHVADAAFYEKVEKVFVLKASTRRKYLLEFYARFKYLVRSLMFRRQMFY